VKGKELSALATVWSADRGSVSLPPERMQVLARRKPHLEGNGVSLDFSLMFYVGILLGLTFGKCLAVWQLLTVWQLFGNCLEGYLWC